MKCGAFGRIHAEAKTAIWCGDAQRQSVCQIYFGPEYGLKIDSQEDQRPASTSWFT